jgi:hypothetical protein
MVQIRKARRSATKLRLLLPGPSGSGKTWGGLSIAKGIGGRTVVIDTEEGSSDMYDHLHEFDVVDLKPPFTPERYVECITACEEAGYDIIVVDSITHEWNGKGGCLELVDEIARAKFKGNTWSAYSEITPRHRAFIDAMLRSKCHIIATARAKTETAQVDEGGRKRVVKLGMAAETRQGVEFEFDIVLDLVHDGHFATVSKDRTGIFGGDPKPITVETGKRLAQWLAGGHAVEPAPFPVDIDMNVVAAATKAIADATTVERVDQLVSALAERVVSGRMNEKTAEEIGRIASQKRVALAFENSNTPAHVA